MAKYIQPGQTFTLELIEQAIEQHIYDTTAHEELQQSISEHDHPFEEIVEPYLLSHSHYFIDVYTDYLFHRHGVQHIPFWRWKVALRVNSHELEWFPHPNIKAYTLNPSGWDNFPVRVVFDTDGRPYILPEQMAGQEELEQVKKGLALYSRNDVAELLAPVR